MSIDSVISQKINFFTFILTPSPRQIYFHVLFISFLKSFRYITVTTETNVLFCIEGKHAALKMLHLVDTVSRIQWFWESGLWWTTLSASIDSVLYKNKHTAVLLEFCARGTHWLWTFVLLGEFVSVEKRINKALNHFTQYIENLNISVILLAMNYKKNSVVHRNTVPIKNKLFSLLLLQ